VENYYSISALAWKKDGSRLTVGTVCGYTDMYDACIKRTRYKNSFEFTFVSPSQAIVKRIASGERMVLKSMYSSEIIKINVYGEGDRYLVANTAETLMCGDLETCKLSEVPWRSSGKEKFVFDNPSVCMIFASGELSLVEYGQNEILGSVRTEHIKPTLVSVCINERPPRRQPGEQAVFGTDAEEPRDNKMIAHVLDPQTVRVVDLCTGYEQAKVNHDSKIDWLELNARGDMLLYRDKRRQLHLYNVFRQTHTTLLTYCNYAQWVPLSDVVVGQNRGDLCVWYNIEAPEKVTHIPIQGEVEEIERVDGRTQVHVDDGLNPTTYSLDEALIGFGSAVDDGYLAKAMAILEQQTNGGQDMREETEAMWKQLSQVSLGAGKIAIAERCFAAIGDVAKARYLHRVYKTMKRAEEATGVNGMDHWLVRAKLAQLRGDFKDAELIFTEQGQTDEAVEMYQLMHKWGEAIRVADQRNHPDAAEMRQSYFDYLLSSSQEEKAAAMRESEGEHMEAIDLYLKGGRPAKAMAVINTHNNKDFHTEVLHRVANALSQSKMHDKAGELFERMSLHDRALEAYMKGRAFRNAVELARREFPAQVVKLELQWGDWLVENKSMDTAIHHYIEAGASKKAIEAALSARLWAKAAQLLDSLQNSDDVGTRPYYKQLAKHYHQIGQHKQAENFYCLAGSEKDAIQMYIDAQVWDAAHKLALRYMSKDEVTELYTQQAQALQAKGKFKEAERQLLAVNEVDHAIHMYKKARKYDDMIRLVGTYRKNLLNETHTHLAQQLEREGQLKQAEEHYAHAGEWQSAVNMYRSNDSWDEAIRVAKFHGGISASKRVAYAWAVSLGSQEGTKLLTKLGLIEQAIDYAIESVEEGSWARAFELATASMPSKLPEVHFKHAIALEDEEKFVEAEEEFIKAEKPKEAIAMYTHHQDWTNAMRVAEQYDPTSMSIVLEAQAKLAAETKDFERATALYINAKKPELALAMYQDLNMWPEAIKFAQRHLPHKAEEVHSAYERAKAQGMGPGVSGNARKALESARMWEDSRNYEKAIDEYMSIKADQVDDTEVLQSAWDGAVRLASKHIKDRYSQVAEEVAGRLRGIKSFTAAAELYKDVDQHKEAIDCYIDAGKWNEAKAHCSVAPAWKSYVDKLHTKQLVKEKDAGNLQKLGKVGAALDLYAEEGRWEELFAAVDKEVDPAIGARYAGEFASQMLGGRAEGDTAEVPSFKTPTSLGTVAPDKINEALARLAKYGSPALQLYFSLYCRLTQEVLSRSQQSIVSAGGQEAYVNTLRVLRTVLFAAVKDPQNGASRRESKSGDMSSSLATVQRLLLVVHLYYMHFMCKQNDAEEMAANLAVAALRFIGDIPCDKAFYTAGQACRDAGWSGKGFVMLNHYLDLSEAIDDQDVGTVDNTDFADTDIPTPYDHALPTEHFLAQDKREEIRDWILSAAMDSDVEQDPINMKWLGEVRTEIGEQLEHMVRRFDRDAVVIEESLQDVRDSFFENR
jgi:intraflagellar transport protein 172